MRVFVRQNWFKIIIAAAVLIVAVTAGHYFISNSGRPLLSQVDCASHAKTFYEQFTKDAWDETDSYTDHLNRDLNKCFIEITRVYPVSTVPGEGTERDLFDALEGKQYAYLMNSKTGELIDCFTSKTGSGYNGYSNCGSGPNDFDNFVKPYMEN